MNYHHRLIQKADQHDKKMIDQHMFVLNEFHTDMMIDKFFVLYLNLKKIIEVQIFRFNINILPDGNDETMPLSDCINVVDDSLEGSNGIEGND